MKLSRRQLIRIIKEETALLNEAPEPTSITVDPLYLIYGAVLNRDSAVLENTLRDLEKSGVDIGALATELETLAYGKWAADIKNAIASSKKQ